MSDASPKVIGTADVAVIGGGPAGLAVAIAACQLGLSALVVDGAVPPVDKPCGEGLMPETLAALDDLGISLSSEDGYPFDGIEFLQGCASVAALFAKGRGLGIRRTALHGWLTQRAEQAGARCIWKTPVTDIEREDVFTAKGRIRARWIVGADGGGSRVRRWAGLDEQVSRRLRLAARRHYRVRPWSAYAQVYWGERLQAYVTPIAAEEVCIVLMGETAEDVRFEHALKSWPELRERLGQAELGSKERGTVTAMHRLRHVVNENVALVGDASGSVDAITGEGLRLCFREALALAAVMKSGDLRAYEAEHRALVQRPSIMGNLMLFMGRHEILRERVVRGMARKPEVFQELLAIHTGAGAAAQYLSAGLQLGWQILAV